MVKFIILYIKILFLCTIFVFYIPCECDLVRIAILVKLKESSNFVSKNTSSASKRNSTKSVRALKFHDKMEFILKFIAVRFFIALLNFFKSLSIFINAVSGIYVQMHVNICSTLTRRNPLEMQSVKNIRQLVSLVPCYGQLASSKILVF